MRNGTLALCVALAVIGLAGCKDEASPANQSASKSALTVTAVAPELLSWPQKLPASGNVVAWQEAVIGPEINNYRITEVLANVGDTVQRGDVLARIASDAVDSEPAESRASVA